MGEALNETAFGEGLVARGKHRDATFEDISTILLQLKRITKDLSWNCQRRRDEFEDP